MAALGHLAAKVITHFRPRPQLCSMELRLVDMEMVEKHCCREKIRDQNRAVQG